MSPVQGQELPEPVVDPLTVPISDLVPGVTSEPLEVPLPLVPEGEFDPTMPDATLPAAGRGVGGAVPAPDIAEFDEDTSVVVERDEFTTTYENADGSSTVSVGAVPVNVQVDGEWEPIQTEVSSTSEGWEVESHPLQPTFGESSAEEGVLTVTRDGYTVSFTLEGAQDQSGVRPVVPRTMIGVDELVYRDVMEGVDLAYEVAPDRVKELLVLDSLPDLGDTMWRWTVDAPGLSLIEDEEYGDLYLVDDLGVPQFLIPAPVMWDSSGIQGVQEPVQHPVDAIVFDNADGTYSVVLSADRAWLAGLDIVYPVFVDPTVQLALGESQPRSYKSDGAVATGTIRVGNSRDGGTNKYWRGVARYYYENAYDKQVVSAVMLGVYDGAGTYNCYNGQLRHATAFAYSGVGDLYSNFPICDYGYASDMGFQNKIAQLVRDKTPNVWLMSLGDEGSAYSYKDIYTQLQISYIEFPTVTAVSPAANEQVSVAPVLKAEGTDPSQVGIQFNYRIEGDNPNDNLPNTVVEIYESGWVSSAQHKVPANVLHLGLDYQWQVGVRTAGGYDGWLGTPTDRWTALRPFSADLESVSPAQQTALPADEEILTTAQPELSVFPPATAPAGTQYQFRISTGVDGRTGVIASSGWYEIPAAGAALTWTPDPGVLIDGSTYTWGVQSRLLGSSIVSEPDWVNQFKFDRRVGAAGPAPTDSAGPVTVNLANGNASLSFASPTVTTVGGPMGFSFNYNSQQEDYSRGLNVKYYNALTGSETTPSSWEPGSKTPLLERIEQAVKFDNGSGSPAPDVVPVDNFIASWNGFITAPTAGSYQFGVTSDDGVKAWVGGTQVINMYVPQSITQVAWGPTISLAAGAPSTFSLQYFERSGASNLSLWVKKVTTGEQFEVPASWFTRQPQVLPGGWSSSTPIAGATSVYAKAQIDVASITLTDISGGVHIYPKNSTGGFSAPAGEYGTLSLTSDGRIVLSAEDGSVYQFNRAGRVESVTPPADGMRKATPSVVFSSNGLVDKIVDPLSAGARFIDLVYQSEAGCGVEPGYTVDTAKKGSLLCKILYPNTTSTRLLYDAAGRLVRIVDPGNEIVDFVYTPEGMLSAVRDPLGYDWAALNPAASPMAAYTEISYLDGRVKTVSLPPADGQLTTPRIVKEYTYDYVATPEAKVDDPTFPDVGAGQTIVDVDALDLPPGAHVSTVAFNNRWQPTTATNALGQVSTQEWNNKDQKLWSQDPWGRVSTAVHNAQDRVTDTYGPAPAQCFDLTPGDSTYLHPVGACPVVPAHTSTVYDHGGGATGNDEWFGLHATIYSNKSLSGTPALFNLGIPGVTGGAVDKNWGTGAVASNVPADNWSMRLTGLIEFPNAGNYVMQTVADDGTRVWIDDVLVVNRMPGGSAAPSIESIPVTAAAGEKKRIRIEYVEGAVYASLQLKWQVPGSSTFVVVPGTALTPNYGLVTHTVTDDSAPVASGLDSNHVPDLVTKLSYSSPWLGAVTQTAIDPDGLNLRTAVAYEPVSTTTGWLRRTNRSMPSTIAAGLTGDQNKTTWTQYHGDTQTIASSFSQDGNVCGLGLSTSQSGLVRKIVQPHGNNGAQVFTAYAYDIMGRTIGVKTSPDAAWNCVTLDDRGRVVSATYPAYGGVPQRTVTTTYNGLTTTVTDTAVTAAGGLPVTATTDLLGRTVTSADVWGTVTVPTYNSAGRVDEVATTPAGGATIAQKYTYDAFGRVTQIQVKNNADANPQWQAYATATYETAGERIHQLAGVTYANGSTLSNLTQNATGASTGLKWNFPTLPGAPVPAATAYSADFESGLDSWASSQTLAASTTAHQGTGSIALSQSTTDAAVASRTITGLTVGLSYTLEAWIAAATEETVVTETQLGVDGIGATTAVVAAPPVSGVASWSKSTYTFTATATSHTVQVSAASTGTAGLAQVLIDDVLLTQDAYTAAGTPQASVTDAVVRSQSGRVMANTLTDGTTVETSTYQFDAAGRLIKAFIPGHELTYGFASSGGCGVNAAAGLNGNRTSYEDKHNGTVVASATYCYDYSDRLTGSNATVPGGNPVVASDLSMTAPLPSLAYDSHGNTTVLADQSMTYDVSNRHMGTRLTNGTTTLTDDTVITYVRDAGGAIVSRTVDTRDC